MSLVFVTGATGQIGVPLVQALVQAGHRVRGLCRTEEAEARLKALGVEPIRGDLRDVTGPVWRGFVRRLVHGRLASSGPRGSGSSRGSVERRRSGRRLPQAGPAALVEAWRSLGRRGEWGRPSRAGRACPGGAAMGAGG